MNNIESIKAKINAANDAAIAELMQKAQQDADAVSAQVDARIAELNARIDAKASAEAQQVRGVAVSSAQLAVKKDILGAKQQLIADVFEQAVCRLCTQKSEDYLKTVLKLALECPAEGGTFRLAEAAVSKLPDCLQQVNAARTAAGMQPFEAGEPLKDVRGGFIVEGGNWRQVCSFESLVAQYREELEPVVAAQLFGKRA